MLISILFSTHKRLSTLLKTLSLFQDLNAVILSCKLLLADNANDSEAQNILKSFQNKLFLDFIVTFYSYNKTQ